MRGDRAWTREAAAVRGRDGDQSMTCFEGRLDQLGVRIEEKAESK